MVKFYSLEESLLETPIYHGPVEFPIHISRKKNVGVFNGLITIFGYPFRICRFGSLIVPDATTLSILESVYDLT